MNFFQPMPQGFALKPCLALTVVMVVLSANSMFFVFDESFDTPLTLHDPLQAPVHSAQEKLYTSPWTAANESLVISPRKSCGSCSAPKPYHRCAAVCQEHEKHDAWEQNLDISFTNHLLESLNNTSILMMGDSIPWQLYHAMTCYTSHPAVNITVDFEGMHLFPLDHESFQVKLNQVLQKSTYAAIVFGVGTWYNLNQAEDWSNPNKTLCPMLLGNSDATTSNTTMEIFKHCCPKTLLSYYAKEEDVYYRAEESRKQCPDLMRRSSFISGLQRLVEVMNQIHHQKRTLPRFIWKEVPPQHFTTLAGDGMFPIGGSGSGSDCCLIKEKDKAYERNRIANDILMANKVGNHLGGSNMISSVSTWDQDVDQWNIHPGRDCTHFCNPSPVTWGWVTAVLTKIVEMV